ncbi:MAG: hypothetical protein WBH01_05820 [Dehalococcoidia bacterium]
MTQIAAGYYHTVGIKTDGTVVAAGYSAIGRCNVGGWTNIIQIAAGDFHTVGAKSDGTVVAVGYGASGRCDVGNWTDIVQVSAGEAHTVGLRADGTVLAVGYSGDGRCDVSDWADITQVAAGWCHTVGVKSNGTVVAVGTNSHGQCDVTGWTNIMQIAAGAWHTVGLKTDGTLVAVGCNDQGQCDISSWTDIIQISAGRDHTVGVEFDGTVVAAGDNAGGQCNIGDWTNIVQVAAGQLHTVGLRADGTVFAAGPEIELAKWDLIEPVGNDDVNEVSPTTSLYLVYQADLSGVEPSNETELMLTTKEVIERRVNAFGITDATIAVQEQLGEWSIAIQLPGIVEIDRVKELLVCFALLEFKEQDEEGNWIPATGIVSGKQLVLSSRYFEENTSISVDQYGKPLLVFEWDEMGGELSKQITTRLLGKPLAIFLGDEPLRGEDGHVIAPVVQAVIEDGAQIEGLSLADATELRDLLNAGKIPVPLGRWVEEGQSRLFESDVPLYEGQVTPATLVINVAPSDSGMVTLSPSQPAEGYVAGTEVTLTAVASEGYKFSHWSGATSGSQSPTTITIDSDKEVSASFIVEGQAFPLNVIYIIGAAFGVVVLVLAVSKVRRRARSTREQLEKEKQEIIEMIDEALEEEKKR